MQPIQGRPVHSANEWGEANAERIRLLPEDWQDTLRMQFREKMLDLQRREIIPCDADGVVWAFPPMLI